MMTEKLNFGAGSPWQHRALWFVAACLSFCLMLLVMFQLLVFDHFWDPISCLYVIDCLLIVDHYGDQLWKPIRCFGCLRPIGQHDCGWSLWQARWPPYFGPLLNSLGSICLSISSLLHFLFQIGLVDFTIPYSNFSPAATKSSNCFLVVHRRPKTRLQNHILIRHRSCLTARPVNLPSQIRFLNLIRIRRC